MCQAGEQHLKGGKLSTEGLVQIYQCWLLRPTGSAAVLSPALLDTCAQIWRETISIPIMSQFHLDVASVLTVRFSNHSNRNMRAMIKPTISRAV
jgi:hypothetical protein